MKNILNSRDGKLYLGDEPFFLVSGDIHYFRIHPDDWRKRLELMRDFGLTAIQTYMPWNLHERFEGKFDFSGMLDLIKFIKIADELSLKVLIRPGPFICSEWENGGVPAWLGKAPEVSLRSKDKRYFDAASRYLKKVCKIIKPYLSTNGGPIIAFCLENEIGAVTFDRGYVKMLEKVIRDAKMDLPLYTTDGNIRFDMSTGMGENILFEGENYRAKPGQAAIAKKLHDDLCPDKPFVVGELWAGRAIYWDEPFSYRDPMETALSFKESLELGGYVNFYMFSGGSNFSLMNGASFGKSYTPRDNAQNRFIVHTTSYDEDSLLSENGQPTEKYFLCRDVLDEFLCKPKREHIRPEYKTQSVKNIKLTKSAQMLLNADVLTSREKQSVLPLTMEDLKADRGFMLYSTHIDAFDNGSETYTLHISGVHDRAFVFENGDYVGEVYRDRKEEAVKIKRRENGNDIVILVENMGRINCGKDFFFEKKGITEGVYAQTMRIVDFNCKYISLDDISKLKYEEFENTENIPTFFKGTFDAEKGVDTFVSVEGFTCGCVFVNGFNLGRYTNEGPQMTLYLPGALLKQTGNVIEILDLSPNGKTSTVNLVDKHILDGKVN